MTAAAPDLFGTTPARAPVRRTSSGTAERAACLALAVYLAVGELGSRGRGGARAQARRDLQELEVLLGIVDAALPAPVTRPNRRLRDAWVGFAPPPDAEQDAAAAACWAAIGEPIEAVILGWRKALGS